MNEKTRRTVLQISVFVAVIALGVCVGVFAGALISDPWKVDHFFRENIGLPALVVAMVSLYVSMLACITGSLPYALWYLDWRQRSQQLQIEAQRCLDLARINSVSLPSLAYAVEEAPEPRTSQELAVLAKRAYEHFGLQYPG